MRSRVTSTALHPPCAHRIVTIAAAFGLALLAGCNNEPPPEQFAEIAWAHYPPFKLDAARIEVVKEYQPTDAAPHVETLVPRTPIDAADRWARDRLQPVGAAGWARFIITEASVVEVPLKVEQGLAYAFTTQQEKRYDAHIAVRLEIHNARGYTDGQVEANATNTHTLPQNATRRETEEVQYLVVQGAMLDLNRALELNIQQHLRQFLRP
jgi:hypothetical protein